MLNSKGIVLVVLLKERRIWEAFRTCFLQNPSSLDWEGKFRNRQSTLISLVFFLCLSGLSALFMFYKSITYRTIRSRWIVENGSIHPQHLFGLLPYRHLPVKLRTYCTYRSRFGTNIYKHVGATRELRLKRWTIHILFVCLDIARHKLRVISETPSR